MAITTQTNQQMYDNFQLVYNNLASNLAPGLDLFEISVYLTKAQKQFVTQMYNDYEKSEDARKTLIELVSTAEIPPYHFTNEEHVRICDKSIFFQIPDDLLYVVYESIRLSKDRNIPACYRCKEVIVNPIPHDDFYQVYKNPFRFNKHHGIRLDLTENNFRLAEIVYEVNYIDKYFIRYIRTPKPIILETLSGTDSIDGQTQESFCELNPIHHDIIVKLAATLAYQDYKSL